MTGVTCPQTCVIDVTYPVEKGARGMLSTIDRVAGAACQAAKDGYQLIVLSDRKAGPERYVMGYGGDLGQWGGGRHELQGAWKYGTR